MNRTLPERIFISGFMGAGKSATGKALAEKLEQPFHDLDSYIERQSGQSIPVIFEAEGEQEFRRMEKSALLDVIRNKKGVIALGGGTLQNQHLVDHVKVNGLLVFLDPPMTIMLDRITHESHRPLLLDEDGEMKSRAVLEEELTALYEQRLPFYEQAEISIDPADFESTDEVAAQLMKKIRYHVALH